MTRNPLGIIALFIVLVYGIAALVLGYSSPNLQAAERQPLVWFLVAFPVLVLAVFYRLVTGHHVKLYAPHDFPDAEGFFRALTPKEQRERLEEDIREFEAEESAPEVEAANSVGSNQDLSARHAWWLAEELAFRELELEFGTTIHRQVALGDHHGVDGVLINKRKKEFKIFEVKFVRSANLMPAAWRAAEHLRRVAASSIPASYVLVIVTEEHPPAGLKMEADRVKEKLKDLPFSLDLRIYDFGELKEKYGLSD